MPATGPIEMPFYIGIDGGGTSTKAALANSNGNIIAESSAAPSNPNNVGFVSAATAINDVCLDILSKADHPEIASIAMGIAGLGENTQQEALKEELIKYPFFESVPIIITHDLEIAFQAELGNSLGILTIIGTGSACYARNHRGNSFRVSGRSEGFDDPGSGYSIVQKAVEQNLITFPTEKPNDRKSFAALCPQVFEKTEELPTQALLKNEIAQLAQLISKAEQAAGFDSPYPLVFVGGLSQQPVYRTLITNNLELACPTAQIRFGASSPIEGALQLARALPKNNR